jgi:hypothetical protein
MSKRAPLPSILTANRLGDGAAVFLDFEGAWGEDIAEALVAHSPDEIRALEDRGTHDAARNMVVEPYLVDVEQVSGRIVPVRYRERVRAGGPTVLGDVPGYAPPAAVPSPRLRGEGQGEGQPQSAAQVSAPHPNLLPVKYGEREALVEAA